MRRSRALRTRGGFTRTGGRDFLVNDPGGWMTEPAIAQPGGNVWGGGGNPGFHWIGSDSPFELLRPSTGEKLAAVNRATSLIVGSLTGVPWSVYRPADRTHLPLPKWLADPQNSQGDGRVSAFRDPLALSPVAFWSSVVTSMLWHGEAFIYTPVRDEQGYPVPPLFVVTPEEVMSDPSSGGFLVGGEWVDAYDLVHLRDWPPYDADGRGIGVLRRHAQTLQLAGVVDTYAESTFSTGVPAGYLQAQAPNLTAADAAALQEAWMSAHGQAARKVAVLNATTTFTPISLKPVDAELVKMQDFTLREIAHAFNMSAHFLDVQGTSNTYANVRDTQLQFRQMTLLPQARLIESALSAHLPAGQELRIRLDGLERGTTGQRYDDYNKALTGGFLTVDEIREIENLPELPPPPTTPPMAGQADDQADDTEEPA